MAKFIRPVKPIDPGFYEVVYKQDGALSTVTMSLGRFTWQVQLLDFCCRQSCTIISRKRVADLKKLTWRTS